MREKLSRSVKERAKRFSRTMLEQSQRIGLNVYPHHFYTQIPDLRGLRNDRTWAVRRSMVGVAGADDVDAQLARVATWMTLGIGDAAGQKKIHASAVEENGEDGGFGGPADASVFFGYLGHHRPGKLVQVGCGVSTAVALQAVDHFNFSCEIICLEPYPTPYLRQQNRAGRIRLIEEPAQTSVVQHAQELSNGDLLFVDSTHTVMVGSEVNVIVHEALPRLKPGVLVHFHDITFPYDFRRDVLERDLFFWGETSLLHAYLSDNPKFRVDASLSMLHHDRLDSLQELVPSYAPQRIVGGLATDNGEFASSIYLRRT